MHDEFDRDGLLLETGIDGKKQRGCVDGAVLPEGFRQDAPEEDHGQPAQQEHKQMVRERGFAEDRCGKQVDPGRVRPVRTLKQVKAAGPGDVIIVDVDPVITVKAQFADPNPVSKPDDQREQNEK